MAERLKLVDVITIGGGLKFTRSGQQSNLFSFTPNAAGSMEAEFAREVVRRDHHGFHAGHLIRTRWSVRASA
jgi:hypothetical protein